jgi:GntR family transcriptional repressor for pyruvate dehydrogenase complex
MTGFQEIHSAKISEQIVEQIKALIRDGHLMPGEKLPTEKALTSQLGVGRSSLREAINALEALGYVEARKHKGIFVRSVGDTLIDDPLRQMLEEDQDKLPHLYDLRMDIELAASQKAAENRDPGDLERLGACLKRMAEDKANQRLTLSDDIEFHLAIARATHNFLRVHILETIFDISNTYIDYIRTKIITDAKTIPVIYAQHEAIFRAIEARQPQAARDHMAAHLAWVEARIDEMFSAS